MIEFSDEKFLLDEIKKGNNQAFEYLFKTYYPRLAMLFVLLKMKKRLVILFKSASCVSGRSGHCCRQYRSHLCFLRWCVMDA